MFQCQYHRSRIIIIAVLVVACMAQSAFAVTLQVSVADKKSKPVSQAVVYAMPLSSTGEHKDESKPQIVDQVDKEFVDYVNVFRVGTPVNFPNHDQIRHHVYSFSKAKKFDIPLYEGMPPKPIIFDKEGVIPLGCNIHDWMLAYIYIVDTPYFMKSDENGNALLDLPPGDYDVRTWHPNLKGSVESTNQRVTITEGEEEEMPFVLKLKKVWRPRRGPTSSSLGGGGCR